MLIKFTDPLDVEQPIYISKHVLEDVVYLERDELGKIPVTVIYLVGGHKISVNESIEETKRIIEEKDIITPRGQPPEVPHRPEVSEEFKLTPQTEPLS